MRGLDVVDQTCALKILPYKLFLLIQNNFILDFFTNFLVVSVHTRFDPLSTTITQSRRLLSPKLNRWQRFALRVCLCVNTGSWCKWVWEQVVRWQAENDVLNVCGQMIYRHHHIQEMIWHHLLLTHSLSMREAKGGVRNKLCEKGNYTFLPSGITEWSKHGM